MSNDKSDWQLRSSGSIGRLNQIPNDWPIVVLDFTHSPRPIRTWGASRSEKGSDLLRTHYTATTARSFWPKPIRSSRVLPRSADL